MSLIIKYLFLFAFCFSKMDGVRFRCDYQYTNYGWFKYHKIPATWYDARLRCDLEGGMLASPTTSDIKSFMMGSLCNSETIFTGIHATFSKGNYHTVNGIPLCQIPVEWAPSEPDNKNDEESCLTLNSYGQLADVRCDKPHPYLCYRKHSEEDVTVCGTTDPDYHFYKSTNKCYKFHIRVRTFSRAHFACSAEGGHLAIINSDEEAQVLVDLYQKRPVLAFIGFSNWGEGSDFRTIHGQTLKEAGYVKFSPGEPNNATGEYCGSILPNVLLNDLGCETHRNFICEKHPNFPPVCDHNNATNDFAYIPVCKLDDTEKKP